ncbi:hypothetical protein Tco_0085912 [Tanacetum coccineum]
MTQQQKPNPPEGRGRGGQPHANAASVSGALELGKESDLVNLKSSGNGDVASLRLVVCRASLTVIVCTLLCVRAVGSSGGVTIVAPCDLFPDMDMCKASSVILLLRSE